MRGQLLHHRPGQGHDAPPGPSLGRPRVQLAPDLDYDLGHIDRAPQQIDTVAEASVSFAGNLTDDPEVRYTEARVARAIFRVAVTGRREQEPSFLTVIVWRDQAEHAAESLSKGSRVVILGRLQQWAWTAEDGSARSTVEVVAEEPGPSLRWATATRSGELLGVDLAAQEKALRADGRVIGTLSRWIADAGGKSSDLVAALAAEAASPLGHGVGDAVQRAKRRFGGLAGADDGPGHLDALLADVDVRPGHELSRLSLPPAAEGAGQLWREPAAPAPSPCPTGCLDDLVDPLMAEMEGCGEFAQ